MKGEKIKKQQTEQFNIPVVMPSFVYRKLQKNENYSVMEIGECDSPRSFPKMWCDRRICEGFWGNEKMAKHVVSLLNGV